jgi:hypothetical protein
VENELFGQAGLCKSSDILRMFITVCPFNLHYMKKIVYFFVTLFIVCPAVLVNAQSCGVSAVYGGGPFYKTPATSIPELRTSGFTTAVIWTIHIDTAGNFNYNAEFPIVANGQYIGHNTYPDFPHNVALLKTQPTSIRRVEVGLSAWGSSTFQNIKNLITAQGTGPTSNLYKNFKALKDSIPDIDAINFDDESTYDVSSSVQFAVMLSVLGYKVALCPYTSAAYWKSVASQTNAQRPGTVDAVFLQCYDGGASNNPCSTTWDFSGISVYPGLWDANYTPSGVQTKMAGWKTQCNINGGFMWLYDDFKNTVKTQQYASAINTALGIAGPAQASGAIPANAATNVAIPTALSWSPVVCAQSHDVYFGTANPPVFIRNQTTIGYNPGTLSPHTTYYWRIDEKNYSGTTTGNVWSFTTNASAGITTPLAGINIGAAYPNPFTGTTTLDLMIPDNIAVTLSVTDIYGHEVYTTRNGPAIKGNYTFSWNGENQNGQKVAAGVYFIKIAAGDGQGKMSIENRKVFFIKS